ncbi:MAG: type II toxin-antitoxin system VapC family toxin [Blastocatellia bacterium]
MDTNILRYLAQSHSTLMENFAKAPDDQIVIPFVVVIEHLRGRFDALLKSEPENMLREQERLRSAQELLSAYQIIYLEDKAIAELVALRQRVKTRKRYTDVVIAAMALAGDHIVVTRNVNDFSDLLPAARIRNWIDHVY